jgi:hypothetical protein
MQADHDALLKLSEQELDLRLGDALLADSFGAKDLTDEDKRRRAENWFAAKKAEFQRTVCSNSFVQGYVQKKDAVERELFDAVLSALTSMVGVPVPFSVLAAKIVRYGVTNLCAVEPPAGAAG